MGPVEVWWVQTKKHAGTLCMRFCFRLGASVHFGYPGFHDV